MIIAAPYLPITIRVKSVFKVMCKAKAFFLVYKISLLNCTDSITTLKSMPILSIAEVFIFEYSHLI